MAVLGDLLKVFTWLRSTVNHVDVRTCLDKGQRHLQTKTAVTARHHSRLALERKLGKNRRGVLVQRLGAQIQHGIHTNVAGVRVGAGVRRHIFRVDLGAVRRFPVLELERGGAERDSARHHRQLRTQAGRAQQLGRNHTNGGHRKNTQ